MIFGIMLNLDWNEWSWFTIDREAGEGSILVGPFSFLWMRSRPFDQSEDDTRD